MNIPKRPGLLFIILLIPILLSILFFPVSGLAVIEAHRRQVEWMQVGPSESLTPETTSQSTRASFTPTPDLTVTPTVTITSTATITPFPTFTPSPTNTEFPLTPTLELTPVTTVTETIPATPAVIVPLAITLTNTTVYLPWISRVQPAYIPATKALFCDHLTSSLPIPDDNSAGASDMVSIIEPGKIVDLDVSLDINHPWIGDLRVKITHQDTGKTITLIDRPGVPATPLGCGNANIKTILDDEISSSVANKCASGPAAISGIYIPETALSAFEGDVMAGNWILNVSDHAVNDVGRLNAWCLIASTSISPPPPTPTPPPPSFPTQRILSGVTGQSQALPLDCESRSAVDWAHYFGYHIGEIDFFNHLPVSDDPDKGFVGSVYGQWGQIPPDPYGVHADPVADLLRQYGVSAYAHRPLTWDLMRSEIGSGRPVMVWIVGSIVNGIPIYITPQDGNHTIVARFEHTVVVTGYTQSSVYFLNGGTIYSTSISQFLDSWSAMGNMAITSRP